MISVISRALSQLTTSPQRACPSSIIDATCMIPLMTPRQALEISYTSAFGLKPGNTTSNVAGGGGFEIVPANTGIDQDVDVAGTDAGLADGVSCCCKCAS